MQIKVNLDVYFVKNNTRKNMDIICRYIHLNTEETLSLGFTKDIATPAKTPYSKRQQRNILEELNATYPLEKSLHETILH